MIYTLFRSRVSRETTKSWSAERNERVFGIIICMWSVGCSVFWVLAFFGVRLRCGV